MKFGDSCSPDSTPALCQTRHVSPLSAGRQQGTAVQPAISTQVQLKPFLFQLTHLTPPEIYLPVGMDCFYSFKTSNCNCSEPIGFKGLPDLMSKPCESAELCQKKKRKSITQISNSWLNRVSTKVNKFYCETWNEVTFAWVHSKNICTAQITCSCSVKHIFILWIYPLLSEGYVK